MSLHAFYIWTQLKKKISGCLLLVDFSMNLCTDVTYKSTMHFFHPISSAFNLVVNLYASKRMFVGSTEEIVVLMQHKI